MYEWCELVSGAERDDEDLGGGDDGGEGEDLSWLGEWVVVVLG